MAAKKEQNFSVSGLVKSTKRTFSLSVRAKSARHASTMAMTLMGSKHGLRANSIEIKEVKKG